MTTRKIIALTRWTFVSKVMSLNFNMLSRLIIAFLLRSKYLLISWLQSKWFWSPPKIKSFTVSIVSPSIFHEVMEPDAMIFAFGMLSFKPTFSLSSFTFIKRLFSSSLLSATRMVSSAIWSYWYFSQQSWFQLVLHPAWHLTWCTLHISQIRRVTIYSLDILLFRFGIVCFSCPVLTIASWPACRFLSRQVRWCGIPIFLRIFHHCCDPW